MKWLEHRSGWRAKEDNRVLTVLLHRDGKRWRWAVREGRYVAKSGISTNSREAKRMCHLWLNEPIFICKSVPAQSSENALNDSVLGTTPSFETALMALNQLLTALHPGPWSPGVVLSYLEKNIGHGPICACTPCKNRWYISLTKFVANGTATPTRTIIFKGRFETPRAAVKAAAEFLLPKNHSALVEQLRKAAEKL